MLPRPAYALAPFTLAVLVGVGCPLPPVYECTTDLNCGAGGRCEDTGYCSFEDPTCPDGRRYGEFAGAGLAELCVSDGVADGSETGGDGDGDGDADGDTAGDGDGDTAGDGDGDETGDGDGDQLDQPIALRLINFSPGEPVYLFDDDGQLLLGPVTQNASTAFVEFPGPWDALSLFYLSHEAQVDVGPDTPSVVAAIAAPRTTLTFVGGDSLTPGAVLSHADPPEPIEPLQQHVVGRIVHAGLILGELDVDFEPGGGVENLAVLAEEFAQIPSGEIVVGVDGNDDMQNDAEAAVNIPASDEILDFFVLSELGSMVTYGLVTDQPGPCLIVPASAP